MIPEEDRGPAWLRDYGFTNFGDIAADINAMAEYARKLATDVQDNYAPRLDGLSAAMVAPLPQPNPNFYELGSFIDSHGAAQTITENNVYAYANGTNVLAAAAERISHDYRGSDAFAHATVADVHSHLGTGTPIAATGQGVE
jgi:hypothetical protein